MCVVRYVSGEGERCVCSEVCGGEGVRFVCIEVCGVRERDVYVVRCVG